MPKVTLSSKNQITLPADIVRKLGLKPGDKIVAELMDDHVVLLPQPESWVNYFAGSLKGVYGSTKEEIDAYVAEERRGWDRDEWVQQFEDLIAADPAAERVVEILLESPRHTLSWSDLRERQKKGLLPHHRGSGDAEFGQIMEKLVASRGVRKLPPPPGIEELGPQYRLVLDGAERYQRERTLRASK